MRNKTTFALLAVMLFGGFLINTEAASQIIRRRGCNASKPRLLERLRCLRQRRNCNQDSCCVVRNNCEDCTCKIVKGSDDFWYIDENGNNCLEHSSGSCYCIVRVDNADPTKFRQTINCTNTDTLDSDHIWVFFDTDQYGGNEKLKVAFRDDGVKADELQFKYVQKDSNSNVTLRWTLEVGRPANRPAPCNMAQAGPNMKYIAIQTDNSSPKLVFGFRANDTKPTGDKGFGPFSISMKRTH